MRGQAMVHHGAFGHDFLFGEKCKSLLFVVP